MRPIMALAVGLLLAAGPAFAQFSVPSLPSLGGQAPSTGALTTQTPEQRRAFCQRVGSAASTCGLGIGGQALTACVIRALPTQDSLRVARVANDARGDASSVLRECGVGAR
ncbi:MAG: hypothetical protein JWO26_2189 [Rhodospirillales bacterium]|jgi:hypothetical protein|nr:hypothetical protein [Rhodospirillales bacterium]